MSVALSIKSPEEAVVSSSLREPLVVSDPMIADRWARVLDFQIDDPNARTPFSVVLAERMFWTREMTDLMILEYKKFMLLCSLYPQNNMTPSVDVDTIWHLHLLYTNCYFRFCRQALDYNYLHHEPSNGNEEEVEFHESSYDETLEKYNEVFGMEPPLVVWGQRVRNM